MPVSDRSQTHAVCQEHVIVITGEYGTYIIRGTQQSEIDPRYMQAAATMKHFQVYDYEGYQG